MPSTGELIASPFCLRCKDSPAKFQCSLVVLGVAGFRPELVLVREALMRMN